MVWKANSGLLGLPEDFRDFVDLAEKIIGDSRVEGAFGASGPGELAPLLVQLERALAALSGPCLLDRPTKKEAAARARREVRRQAFKIAISLEF